MRQNYEKDLTVDSTELYQLIDDIERALFTFESTSNHALMRAYRSSNWEGSIASLSAIEHETEFDHMHSHSSESESIFLVYQ